MSPPPLVSPVKHLVLIGLGNLPYPLTKHSIGHLIVDSLAKELDMESFDSSRALQAHVTEGYIDHPFPSVASMSSEKLRLTLAKPRPLMNLSGKCLTPLLEKYPMSDSTQYALIYDHLDFPEGKHQVRRGGSANGHNGVKSCLAVLKGRKDDIWQARVGVGMAAVGKDAMEEQRSRSRENVSNYVLSALTRSQIKEFSPGGANLERLWGELVRLIFTQSLPPDAKWKSPKPTPLSQRNGGDGDGTL